MSNILLFKDPEMKAGRNVTVRRGIKWSLAKVGDELIVQETDFPGDICTVVITDVQVFRYEDLTEQDIEDEHASSCRTLDGLWKAMVRAYPSFDSREIVTVLSFEEIVS